MQLLLQCCCGTALLPVRLCELERGLMATAGVQLTSPLKVRYGRGRSIPSHLYRSMTSVHERELGMPPCELLVGTPCLLVEASRKCMLGCMQ